MKLFLLNETEASKVKTRQRRAGSFWWLRSSASRTYVNIVTMSGGFGITEAWTRRRVLIRPGIRLRPGALTHMERTKDDTYLLGRSGNAAEAVPMEWVPAGSMLIAKDGFGCVPFNVVEPEFGATNSEIYELSNACSFLEELDSKMFTETERELLFEAPEGRIDVDGKCIRISLLRKYLSDLGLMDVDGDLAGVLRLFAKEDVRVILCDLMERKAILEE